MPIVESSINVDVANTSSTDHDEDMIKRVAERVLELWREELRLNAERRGKKLGK